LDFSGLQTDKKQVRKNFDVRLFKNQKQETLYGLSSIRRSAGTDTAGHLTFKKQRKIRPADTRTTVRVVFSGFSVQLCTVGVLPVWFSSIRRSSDIQKTT
jgi:hypothetical protein